MEKSNYRVHGGLPNNKLFHLAIRKEFKKGSKRMSYNSSLFPLKKQLFRLELMEGSNCK